MRPLEMQARLHWINYPTRLTQTRRRVNDLAVRVSVAYAVFLCLEAALIVHAVQRLHVLGLAVLVVLLVLVTFVALLTYTMLAHRIEQAASVEYAVGRWLLRELKFPNAVRHFQNFEVLDAREVVR